MSFALIDADKAHYPKALMCRPLWLYPAPVWLAKKPPTKLRADGGSG
jgi:hypothetical protein